MEDNNYAFDFKMVNGGYSKSYIIDVTWTMYQFLDAVRQEIQRDFPLHQIQSPGVNSWQKIEVIEAGQYFNNNGRDPEKAPALHISELTLREYFNKRLSTTSFYVR